MRFLVAPASFKGSLSAFEAADAMALGVRDALPDAEIDGCPMADGGEGTAEILARACVRFEERWMRTVDALGRPIDARWFLVREGPVGSRVLTQGTAVVDAASCLGITLIDARELDPDRASSAGLGAMIRAIADEGAARIVVGLGGTATMDAGIGCAGALGWRFTETSGAPVEAGAVHLGRIARATPPAESIDAEIIALCDVRAPLTGPLGAARVFGPQKGATPAQVDRLDSAMAHLAEALELADAAAAGAGAAGGLGWGLMAFAGARVAPGAEFVAEAVGLGPRARAADLVITGEGRLDAQTAMGKAIGAVCRAASDAGRPVAAIVGRVQGDRAEIGRTLGVARIAELSAGAADDAAAMREARTRVRAAGAAIAADLVGFRSGS
jgi:glycerate kinase